MVVASPKNRYEVGKMVGEADTHRLYLCEQEGTGRLCLLQIASDAAHNGTLDQAAFILTQLARRASEVEEKYARVKTDPKDLLNYGLGFPELVDNFVLTEQGGRRVNILAFRGVDDVRKMVPIGNVIRKDHLRVDLRTSVWIMGKVLKLLAFAHRSGISVGRLDDTNLLIEPDQHYVVIFDWTCAYVHAEATVPAKQRRTEISQAANVVIALLGGDCEARSFPDDGENGAFTRYTDHLLALASGDQHDALHAHGEFYALIDDLWARAFHPFTTHDLQ